jgi:hypothetical protein
MIFKRSDSQCFVAESCPLNRMQARSEIWLELHRSSFPYCHSKINAIFQTILRASQPISQPASQSASQPASQPTNQSLDQSINQSISQPASHPAGQPFRRSNQRTSSSSDQRYKYNASPEFTRNLASISPKRITNPFWSLES